MSGYWISPEISMLLDRRADLMEEIEQSNDQHHITELRSELVAIDDTLEGEDFNIEALAENLAKDIRNNEMDAKAYKEEAKRWAEKATRSGKRAESIRALLKYILESNGQRKLKAGMFDLSIANNGGKLPIKYYVDPAELPEEFRLEEVTYKADDKAIRTFLDEGGESDQFRYGERGTNLRIK